VKLSKLERFLRLFTEVRPGEGVTAILLFANVFLVLCAYYLIKPLREGWIAVSDIEGFSKMEVKAYSSFGQSLLLVFVVSAYARLSARVSRSALITGATLFCMSNLIGFAFWQPGGLLDAIPGSGIAFYLWVGMFGVFVVAQFWTFAADVYEDERGRRLMPMIAIGATGGAAFGASIVGPLVESEGLGANVLLLSALVPLAGSIALTRWVDAREHPASEPSAATVAPENPEAPEVPVAPVGTGRGGFGTVMASRLLMATALITLLLNWVNTNGENLLFGVIQETLQSDAAAQGITQAEAVIEFTRNGTTAFYGDFFTWVNLVALFLQAIVASRLLKYGGFGAILMLLPAIALVSYTAMALLPILAVIKVMKIAENSTDYSINNTARHVLWLPVTSEMTFKGKPTIDTLFVRIGDGMAALTVVLGVNVFALTTQAYFVFNVTLVLLWIAFSVVVIREHRKLTLSLPEQGAA
jgi:AAA family ATP:ADP antiporter